MPKNPASQEGAPQWRSLSSLATPAPEGIELLVWHREIGVLHLIKKDGVWEHVWDGEEYEEPHAGALTHWMHVPPPPSASPSKKDDL